MESKEAVASIPVKNLLLSPTANMAQNGITVLQFMREMVRIEGITFVLCAYNMFSHKCSYVQRSSFLFSFFLLPKLSYSKTSSRDSLKFCHLYCRKYLKYDFRKFIKLSSRCEPKSNQMIMTEKSDFIN